MMHRTFWHIGFALMLSSPIAAWAQRPTIVGPLAGYQCMMLNITEKQALDPNFQIPVYTQPSETSQPFGYASLQVAVQQPPRVVNGFTEMLFPTGAKVWIKTGLLRPYRSLGDPSARCNPVSLSNGHVGFDHPHS